MADKLTVHVVYTEYQNGECCVNGIFHTEAGAEARREAEIVTQETEYHNQVFNHVPAGVDPDEYDEAEWDVDIHVEAVEVEP